MNQVTYYKKNIDFECIYYKDWSKAFPLHTHTNHIIFGIVKSGSVCIIQNGISDVISYGNVFCILPNVPHEIKPYLGGSFSMLLYCAKVTEKIKDNPFFILRQNIIDNPENEFFIKNMASYVNYSQYYFIRRFKDMFGLTPHQFQIQCRIRKAQRLLDEGKSIAEVAYDTGFCDESHFDHCFFKFVQLTPSEYKEACST